MKYYLFIVLGISLSMSLKAQIVKTSTVGGKRYSGYLSQQGFYLIKSRKDTVLQLKQAQADYFDFHFKDFNKDGYEDIYLEWSGNIPERYSRYLFVPSKGKFKELKNFSNFPSTQPLAGTHYYYSYFPSGCANDAWGSYLFYIKDYSAIKMAKIKGDGCGIDDGISIFKVINNKESLIKRLPLNTINKYRDRKWGFIKSYWQKNYRIFVPSNSASIK